MPLIPELQRQRQRQDDPWAHSQSGLQNEFQDNQSYPEKPSLEKQKQINKNVCINHKITQLGVVIHAFYYILA